MTAALLEVRGLVKRFGGLVATDHVDLDLRPGEIHALIGPNGAGKTTLCGQLIGEMRPDAGEIRLDGRSIGGLGVSERVRRGVARTFQITQLLPDYTVLDNVMLALQARDGSSFRFFAAARRDRRIGEAAMAILADGGLADRAGMRVADLSHGERKQLELDVALATGPRILLLDEPMAGLGPAESAAMVERLAGLKGRLAMLLVEHDMEAVFALADRISVLVYGRVIASGSVEAVRADPEVRRAYLGEGDA